MKYGQTLRQRSIPEWNHYNVDYDDIKRLIKTHTTPTGGQAVSIPGQNQEVEQSFEDTLYNVLLEQHERIDLFVRSKTGEIQRRLVNLEDQVQRLNDHLRAARTTKITARRLEKYGRLENNVLGVGNEIRSLSRFVGAQRLAFLKLLKKYKKWTRSEALERRFRTDLNRPGTFSSVDLSPFLGRWAELLQDVRAPFQSNFLGRRVDHVDVQVKVPSNPILRGSATSQLNESHPARPLQTKPNFASAIDFDTALAATPKRSRSTLASYWVHVDNVVELQIMLLQFMQLLSYSTSSSPISRSSSFQSQLRSTNVPELQSPLDGRNDSNIIVIDDLHYFVQEGAKTASTPEEPALPRLSARYNNNCNEAVMTLSTTSDFSADEFVSSRSEVKHIGSLLDIDKPFRQNSPGPSTPSCGVGETDPVSIHVIREWVKSHAEARPLVGICSQRARFMDLDPAGSKSLVAVLDKHISMTSLNPEDLLDTNRLSNLRLDSRPFRHALLHIRQVGTDVNTLLSKLDQSHLVERIYGFSIETHAVWECYRPEGMQPPHWVPRLDQDIRKVPSDNSATQRERNSSTYPTSSNTKTATPAPSALGPDQFESSDTAVELPEPGPSGAAARLKKAAANASRKQKRKLSFQTKTSTGEELNPGYWNEYDDPEDDNDDDYVIWVSPGSSLTLMEWLSSFVPSWLRSPSLERRPLLPRSNSNIEEDLNDDSSSTSEESPIEQRRTKSYGTVNPLKTRVYDGASETPNYLRRFLQPRGNRGRTVSSHSRSLGLGPATAVPDPESDPSSIKLYERTRTLLTLFTYSASLAVFAVICVLAATGRHKQAYQVEAGIVFGIIVNLLFACVGLGCLMSGRRTSWIAWSGGLLLFAVICVGNGGLCAWLVT
ncbi:MAG: hypothetical protein M1821_006183 [Bathelium mastoideum]|nr:MAG: hypothetical protein M1821_006183 [Bathelium mastoideum]